MGCCLRRARAQAEATLLAELNALTSLRKLPAKRRPGREPPSSHDAALSALRYRFGCRWHKLHAMRVQASQMGLVTAAVKLAFITLRLLAKKQHKADMWLLNYLKLGRGE